MADKKSKKTGKAAEAVKVEKKAAAPTKVYKKITVVGCSPESYDAAIKGALAKAGESLHNLAWWEVKELRGGIIPGGVLDYQVTLEVGFKLD